MQGGGDRVEISPALGGNRQEDQGGRQCGGPLDWMLVCLEEAIWGFSKKITWTPMVNTSDLRVFKNKEGDMPKQVIVALSPDSRCACVLGLWVQGARTPTRHSGGKWGCPPSVSTHAAHSLSSPCAPL